MTLLNRFAVSLLSREYKDDAVPQELMIHKASGQILLKTVDGNVISYDSLTRLRNHIDNTTFVAYNLNIDGNLYSLELSDIELPEVILDESNLLLEPYIITNIPVKILISIDMDCVEVVGDQTLIEVEPSIRMSFTITNGVDTPLSYSLVSVLSENNIFVLEPVKLLPLTANPVDYTMSLTEISIVRNSNIIIDRVVKNIVHSILVLSEDYIKVVDATCPLLLNL